MPGLRCRFAEFAFGRSPIRGMLPGTADAGMRGRIFSLPKERQSIQLRMELWFALGMRGSAAMPCPSWDVEDAFITTLICRGLPMGFA